MNVKNNKRHQETIENIEKAFVLLLKDNELKFVEISPCVLVVLVE